MPNLDLLFPDKTRAPYYFFAPHYSRFSAGSRVLHLLCHLLNRSGQAAFLLPENPLVDLVVNPDLVTPLLTNEIIEAHFNAQRTPIIIYPETIVGNPLNAGCVVRYLLNYPGLLGGPKEFPDENLLLWYSAQMKSQLQGVGLVLSFPVSDPVLYSPPPPGTKRQGSCFYAAKFRRHSGEELSPLTKDSIEIPGWASGGPTQQEIADLFRRSEVFYCYESSALALEAILCGCPAVLIPSKFHDKPILVEPMGWAGAAWGASPEELARAKSTVDQAQAKYQQWIDQSLAELGLFIEESQKRARRIPYRDKIRPIDPSRPENALKKALRSWVPPAVLTAKWKLRQLLFKRR